MDRRSFLITLLLLPGAAAAMLPEGASSSASLEKNLAALAQSLWALRQPPLPPCTVAPYQEARDRQALIGLFRQNREWLYGWRDKNAELAHFNGELARTKYGAPGFYWWNVARCDEQTVGFVTYRMRSPHAGHILFLEVDENFRRRGIGHQLMETAIAALKTKGAQVVTIDTGATNYRAQSVYKSLGFVQYATMGADISLRRILT